MAKKKQTRLRFGQYWLLLSLIVVIVIVFFFGVYAIPRNQESETSTKLITSSDKDFFIRIPIDYQYKEYANLITISAIQNKNLKISKTATDFENVEDYLADLDKKNNYPQIISEENIVIDNIDFVKRIILFGSNEEQSIYTGVEDYWVYNLYTSDPSLYPTLDQIAQSFEYTGEDIESRE